MLWLIRLQRFVFAFLSASIVYVVVNLEFRVFLAEVSALFVFIFIMVWSWIEWKMKISNIKSLSTNRHVFNEARKITEIIPNWFKSILSQTPLAKLVNIRRGTDFGLGGSAKFASVFEHWEQKYNQKRGDIFLGCSVWDHNCFMGQFDDKSGITLSEPRNGKGTSFIIPNLQLYQGSILVMDGKNGENLDATGSYRENKGRVLCIDPYGMSQYGEQYGTVRFNPLAGLDPNSETILDDLAILGDALVIKSGDAENDHFADGGERLIKALIAHMISSHDNPNLADLPDMIIQIMGGDKVLFDAMKANTACHGVIQKAAVVFSEPTSEIRNFISNAVKSTEWLTRPPMREVLSTSDFSFQDLKEQQGTSIYLVLDSDTIKINAPFLRLFVNVSIRAMRKGDKPKIPVLFLLDEFYSLGRMDQLSDNISEIPGYGIKLWPVMHNIGQLKKLYRENWKSFLGGTQVYFGLNQDTAEYVEKELGTRGFEREDERDDKIQTSLLSADEIRNITSNAKEYGNQIVIRADGVPVLLRRVPYYTRQFKNISKILIYAKILKIKVQRGDFDPLPFTDEEKQYIGYTYSYWTYKHYLRLLEVITNNDYPGVARWSAQFAYERKAIKTPEWQVNIEESKIDERIALEILLESEYMDFREIYGISNYHSLNDFETKYGFFVLPRENYFGEYMKELLSAITTNKHGFSLKNNQTTDLIRYLISKSIMRAREENGGNLKKEIDNSSLNLSLSSNYHYIDKVDFFEYLKAAEAKRQQKKSAENDPSSEETEDTSNTNPEDSDASFALNVEAARKRWVLPETFIEEQVKERYPIILDNAGADEFEQVEQDYKILMQAASLFKKESRNITMPDGSIQSFLADKSLWNKMDHLIENRDYTQEKMVDIASINAKEAKISFKQSLADVIAHFYNKHTQGK